MNNTIKKIREKESKLFNIENKIDKALFYLDELKRCVINDPYNKPSNKEQRDDMIEWIDSLSLEEKEFLGSTDMKSIINNVYGSIIINDKIKCFDNNLNR